MAGASTSGSDSPLDRLRAAFSYAFTRVGPGDPVRRLCSRALTALRRLEQFRLSNACAAQVPAPPPELQEWGQTTALGACAGMAAFGLRQAARNRREGARRAPRALALLRDPHAAPTRHVPARRRVQRARSGPVQGAGGAPAGRGEHAALAARGQRDPQVRPWSLHACGEPAARQRPCTSLCFWHWRLARCLGAWSTLARCYALAYAGGCMPVTCFLGACPGARHAPFRPSPACSGAPAHSLGRACVAGAAWAWARRWACTLR